MSFSVKRLTADAMLLCAALLFSYLESLIPLSLWIPVPGFKLGLPNLVIMFAALYFSFADAMIISLCRIFLTALLFGNTSSLFFSLIGGILSLVALELLLKLKDCPLTCIGLSVSCAAFHNIGQLLAASVLFSTGTALMYAPWLILLALVSGTINGILLRLLLVRLCRFVFMRKYVDKR